MVVDTERNRVSKSVQANTIIVSRMNTLDLVGASAYVSRNHPNLYLPDRLWQVTALSNANPRWLSYVLASSTIRNRLKAVASGTSGSMKNLSQDPFLQLPAALPSLDEQHRIVAALNAWDGAITHADRQFEAATVRMAALRVRLTQPQSGWQRVKLASVTSESRLRNKGGLDRDLVMAVTKDAGLRPMREETIASNIKHYKLVRPSAFAYNPMRLNIGSIAVSGFEHDVLVSPDYVVFECEISKLLPAYLDHFRATRAWSSYFSRAGDGGVRVRIYYDDLAHFILALPPMELQTRIVRVLNAAIKEVELLTLRQAALQQQKRGLMQKLLTGEWRLTRDLPVPAEAANV